MYFLKRFSICFGWRMFLMVNPKLPSEPSAPKSPKKKFMTCSGWRSNCLHKDVKLVMAVFFLPIRFTSGGLRTIFVFYARSGLFLLSVSQTLFKRSKYLFSLFFLSSSWFYLSLASSVAFCLGSFLGFFLTKSTMVIS